MMMSSDDTTVVLTVLTLQGHTWLSEYEFSVPIEVARTLDSRCKARSWDTGFRHQPELRVLTDHTPNGVHFNMRLYMDDTTIVVNGKGWLGFIMRRPGTLYRLEIYNPHGGYVTDPSAEKIEIVLAAAAMLGRSGDHIGELLERIYHRLPLDVAKTEQAEEKANG